MRNLPKEEKELICTRCISNVGLQVNGAQMQKCQGEREGRFETQQMRFEFSEHEDICQFEIDANVKNSQHSQVVSGFLDAFSF